jgi:hypothetical protein
MRTIAQLALYCAALAFGTYQTFYPSFDSGFARTQTEHGDSMLNHYLLENSWLAVSDPNYCGSVVSPPCFYPERYTLWYTEHLLGIMPVYWAIRCVLPYDLAYDWWQILVDALNFAAFAVVIRWLRGPHILAILGGYLWAYALVNIDQIKHQQLIPRFWMPFAAYYAWSFTLIPTTRALARMLGFAFLQCLICVYTGWFLVAGLGVFLPLAIAFRPGAKEEIKRFVRENRSKLIRIAGIWFGALVIAFTPYIIVNWGMMRLYQDCYELVPTPSAWWAGPPGSRWQKTIAPFRKQVSSECVLFCGFGIYIVIYAAYIHLFALRRFRRSAEMTLAAGALLTAAIWVLITLTPNDGGPSLWQIVRYIPGGTAIRCVSRVSVVVYLFGFLGSLVWLNAVTAHLRPLARAIVLGSIASVVIFEQTGYRPPSFEKVDFYPIADRSAAELRGADVGYVLPKYTDTKGQVFTEEFGEVLGMWAGLRANVPVVNGYSGRWPRGWEPPTSDEMYHKWLDGRFRGKLVIVDPDHPERVRTLVIE